MNQKININIHEAFNAKTLPIEKLCENFIVNEHFEELMSQNHSIMIGPRGSGKTTLMRMLSVNTLSVWSSSESEYYKKYIKFSGVYIPTDRLLKNQYDQVKKEDDSEEKISLINIIFYYHIFENLILSLLGRLERYSKNTFNTKDLDKNDEIELVKDLARLWKVTPNSPTLKSLLSESRITKSEISSNLSKNIKIDNYSLPEINLLLTTSVNTINLYLNEYDHYWCFLFDELELAPENIIQSLIDNMRSGGQGFLYKLALCPYHENIDNDLDFLSSMNNEDYHTIELNNFADKRGEQFSKKMLEKILSKKGFNKKIEDYFEAPKKLDTLQCFTELSSKDPSFAHYLATHDIVIEELDSYTENDKNPTIRKIKFIAQIRNEFLKKKKRKPDIYAGWENLCKAVEYNPRMLIGIINKLSPKINDRKIPLYDQISTLKEFLSSYKSLINTIVLESPIKINNNENCTIIDLIELIGDFFQQQITGDKFIGEPKGSILINNDVDEKILRAIGLALNFGALVEIKSEKKKRVRLSYIFSHHYWLSMTIQTQTNINELIELKNQSSPKKPKIQNGKQLDLYDSI